MFHLKTTFRLGAAVLTAAFVAINAPAAAQTLITGPQPITAPGSYQLAADIFAANGPVLEIQSDDVHLDLAGFQIRLNDPQAPVIEMGDHGGVRITNGMLLGGSIAVRVETLSTGNVLDVDDVLIDDFHRSGIWVEGGGGTVRLEGNLLRSAPNANNGEAIRLSRASGLLQDNTVMVSGDAMEGLVSGSDTLHLADNTLRVFDDFGSRAVRLIDTDRGSLLRGNILRSPGIALWVAFGSEGSHISENLMRGARGLFFEGAAEGHSVDWNHFADSTEGVVFGPGVGGDNALSNNRCLVPFGNSCTLAHHQVIWPWGWHDLGGNRGH